VGLRTKVLVVAVVVATLSGCAAKTSCSGDSVNCGGICVTPLVDNFNCGACGSVCGAGTICEQGSCVVPCPAGQIACDGACVDPRTSRTYCGASGDCAGAHAGTTCSAWLTCQAGACGCATSGQVSCDSACVDPRTSATHCGATGDCTGANAGTTCAAGQTCQSGTCVQSCVPVALDLATPFATTQPPFPSHHGQQIPTALWASTTPPLPTNTTWQNLVLGTGDNRFDMVPYQLRAEPAWLAIGVATPAYDAVTAIIPDVRQIRLGALEFAGVDPQRTVQSYDLLSVTLRYAKAAGTMTAPLVQGSPYVTADYTGSLRPMVMPGSVGLTSVNGSTAGGRVSGTRFQLGLGDGTTWVLYASASVAFDWVAGSAGQMVAAAAFTGTLRVANAPSTPSIAALDAHAGVVPRSGSVAVATACDVARLQFIYTTTGTGSLLMTAMPHHMARLVSPVTAPLPYATLSGVLQGVEGSTWTMSLPLSPIGFSAPRAVASQYRSAVLAALVSDASFVPDPLTVSNDSYVGGKLMAKLARLALIADDLGETATAANLRTRLTPLVAAWLDRTNGNPFVYDDTWGGVVTVDALANPGALFGSGHYNDHHFHYGYFLYAAAALAKAEPSFATAHRGALLGLVRDIANPSGSDPHFPRFRHMDFFRGHSWAAGLTDAPEGQDQESTSEAVNAWDGMHLLGVAWSDTRMAELGRVLRALETDGARTYWQIPSASTIYGAPFKNNMCVGILRATRAEFGTFFGGAGPQYVYGIQMIPYTPASENLISPIWVGDAWTKMSAAAAGADQGWKGFLYMAHGTTDRAAAWTEVNTLTGFDNGNSKTNTLWWVATRP
jgi:endo-1,3(4)-beta-glucanase